MRQKQQKHKTRRLQSRQGYALMLVCAFIVLFLGLLGIAWRQVGALLRIEKAVELRNEGDEGSVRVLALAMQVLETRLCWDAASSAAKINIAAITDTPDYRPASGASFCCKKYYNASSDSSNPNWQYYLITFTKTDDDAGQSPPQSKWTVKVALSTATATTGYPDLPSSPP